MVRAEGGGGGEDAAWNSRTRSMEVAATASLVLHPSSSRLAIGMWHHGAAAGALYSVEVGPVVGGAAEGAESAGARESEHVCMAQ